MHDAYNRSTSVCIMSDTISVLLHNAKYTIYPPVFSAYYITYIFPGIVALRCDTR